MIMIKERKTVTDLEEKKEKRINPISAFLTIMGVVVIVLTFWILLTTSIATELYWLLFAIGFSLGITEIVVAWLIDIHSDTH